MALLSRNRKEPSTATEAQPVRAPRATPRSVLAADLEICGEVRSSGAVEVEGAFDGVLDCRQLVIGEDATVRGTIIAEDLRVHGTLDGQVKAKTLALLRTANVTGEISHHSLSIESGAFIEADTHRLAGETFRAAALTSLSSSRPNDGATAELDTGPMGRKVASAR